MLSNAPKADRFNLVLSQIRDNKQPDNTLQRPVVSRKPRRPRKTSLADKYAKFFKD